jgi:lipid-binding SYLF domain-containing protein
MKAGTMGLTGLIIVVLMMAGCGTVPNTPEARTVLSAQVKEAIVLMKAEDPSIDNFFEKSYGYAVLPKVFKGAIWIGGAKGKGEVYEHRSMVGYCSMTQATLGFSFGGEYFREIIFFRDKEDLDKFKAEEYVFSAQATGVAITSGAAAKADYKSGSAVFVMTDKGLMVDASLGGQRFNYVPKASIK